MNLAGPAAVWFGFIPVTGIAVAYYYINRADANCGAAYSWASKALHPSIGFLNGWVVIVTDVIFMSFAAPQGGGTSRRDSPRYYVRLGPVNLWMV